MPDEQIYVELNRIFSDVFLRDDIALTPQTTAADIEGWDSFAQIEIILAAQERFGIKLTTVEIDSLRRVGDLVQAIAAKVA